MWSSGKGRSKTAADLGDLVCEAEQASVPGSATGPVASNEDAEAERVGGVEHFEMCVYLCFSGSNYYWTCFLECVRNYLTAVWLCWFFLILIAVQPSSNGSVRLLRASEAE